MKPRPEWIVCGENGLRIVVYRFAPERRGVWRRALILTAIIWLIALMTLAHAGERSTLQRIRYVADVDAAIAAAEWIPTRTCQGWWTS